MRYGDQEVISKEEFDAVMENAFRLADRREFLCRNAPVCPECNTKNIQIIDWFSDIAEWKCRECKTKFKHEP